MATSETYKDRNSGERITQTEWHNIVIWRGMAETAEKYLKKGSQVFIEGENQNPFLGRPARTETLHHRSGCGCDATIGSSRDQCGRKQRCGITHSNFSDAICREPFGRRSKRRPSVCARGGCCSGTKRGRSAILMRTLDGIVERKLRP